MTYADMGSHPINSTIASSSAAVEQDWKLLTTYQAKSSSQEKVYRAVNIIVLGTALYGAGAIFTGPVGLVTYAGWILGVRKIASTAIGYLVYPIAFETLLGTVNYCIKMDEMERDSLKKAGYLVKKISVYKSGIKYDAAIIGHTSTIDNGKWTIHALGNGMAMECFMFETAKKNLKNKSNTLLMNGPSVCESGGWPTRYQMGAGFEAGIQLLEHGIRATHIVMQGLSLGGGMMAEAILNHDFTEGKNRKISYLSISDRTFSRLSTIAGDIAGSVVEGIFYVIDAELDGIGAAKKLSHLDIRQIVIQHISPDARGSDGVIPDSPSLAHKLHQEGGLRNKVFLESDEIVHNGELPRNIESKLNEELQRFFQNS